ncbi:zinc ribbon domain-containing protein [Paenibacillus illinoisensis]
MLTGLVRCPECGAAMTASRTVNRSKDGEKITRMYSLAIQKPEKRHVPR